TEPGARERVVYDENGVRYYLTAAGDIDGMAADFQTILRQENPDIVHLYGTEFAHSLAMAKVADPDRLVVTIQGSLAMCKDAAFAGIPERVCRDTLLHKTLRALHKGGECIEQQKRSFEARAAYEEQVLQTARYIHGGSEWGCSVARWLHPGCTTFDFGLLLRDSFYTEPRWDVSACERHSIYAIFTYPINGFHKLLEAVAIVRSRFPDVKVYAVGNPLGYRNYTGFRRKLMDAAPDYRWYVQRQIERLDLKDHVEFLGYLDEAQVQERLLRSHVFVSASAMENQSTALGEAMMLGVPSVASCVGAMQEMIDDGEDGFLYPFAEPHLLGNQIGRIFESDELARQFSARGHAHAARTYNREENCRRMMEMYTQIMEHRSR
ncbi:MAG: glycosyltransferase, partial [Clostridia bacterium]|nr:glycosyltransferase [Clostridia bacterium]